MPVVDGHPEQLYQDGAPSHCARGVGLEVWAQTDERALLCTRITAALHNTFNYTLWMRDDAVTHHGYGSIHKLLITDIYPMLPRFYHHPVCYRLNVCVPPKSICCNPDRQCDGIKRWRSPSWLSMRAEPSWMGFMTTQERPLPFSALWRPTVELEASPHQTLNMPAPWSWTCQSPELPKINCCHL